MFFIACIWSNFGIILTSPRFSLTRASLYSKYISETAQSSPLKFVRPDLCLPSIPTQHIGWKDSDDKCPYRCAPKKETRRDKREDTSCSARDNSACFKGLDRCSDISSETGIHRIVYRAKVYRVTRPTKG